jgi:hypothetical protein
MSFYFLSSPLGVSPYLQGETWDYGWRFEEGFPWKECSPKVS